MSRTHTVPIDPDLVDVEDKRTFHSRLVLTIGAVAFVVLSVIGWTVAQWLTRDERQRVDQRLTDAVALSAARVERFLGDHERLVSVLASSPSVIDAARAGGERWRREGLGGRELADLEARFDERRSLEVDNRLRAYLRQLRSTGDIAEIIVTDVNGANAVTTGRTSDCVGRSGGSLPRSLPQSCARLRSRNRRPRSRLKPRPQRRPARQPMRTGRRRKRPMPATAARSRRSRGSQDAGRGWSTSANSASNGCRFAAGC
jgi:hypothetical protein